MCGSWVRGGEGSRGKPTNSQRQHLMHPRLVWNAGQLPLTHTQQSLAQTPTRVSLPLVSGPPTDPAQGVVLLPGLPEGALEVPPEVLRREELRGGGSVGQEVCYLFFPAYSTAVSFCSLFDAEELVCQGIHVSCCQCERCCRRSASISEKGGHAKKKLLPRCCSRPPPSPSMLLFSSKYAVKTEVVQPRSHLLVWFFVPPTLR